MPVEQEVFYRCFRLPEAGEEFKLYSASVIFTILQSRYPAAMRGMDGGAFRQDDERHGGGTDAYGERKSVQGGAGGIIPVHQAG